MIFLLIMVLGSGNSNNTGNGDSGNYEETVAYDTSAFKEITPSDISKESKGKTIVVWVGRQSCSYCGMYAPVLEDVGKDNNVTIYYVDLEDLINFDSQYPYISDERNYNILEGLDGIKGWETFAKDNMGGTPLTLIIKDNKVIGGLNGYTEENGVLDEFKRTGLIEN
jgi:predicted bacteriocin transport accessory protein